VTQNTPSVAIGLRVRIPAAGPAHSPLYSDPGRSRARTSKVCSDFSASIGVDSPPQPPDPTPTDHARPSIVEPHRDPSRRNRESRLMPSHALCRETAVIAAELGAGQRLRSRLPQIAERAVAPAMATWQAGAVVGGNRVVRPRLAPGPAALRLSAHAEFEPFLGKRPSALCGLTSAVSRSTLLCGIIVSPGRLVPRGMLFSERRACLKRDGRSAHHR
jgi:hypothetical protein